MDNIAHASEQVRKELFGETAARKGMSPAVVEKDFWVCWILGKIFADESLSRRLLFKGGTSLSKAFGLIRRFSEDVDLILDWRQITDEDPSAERSNSSQTKLNKAIEGSSRAYLANVLLPELGARLGDTIRLEIKHGEPDVISVYYPKSFDDKYIRPEVRLEVGPLATWLPNEQKSIMSYAAEQFPGLFTRQTCTVQVIRAERTFWEKATILHHEANRPESNPQPPRYSRHYYDLAMMCQSPVRATALEQIDLLASVVAFKMKFYPRSWARYELAKPGTLRLVPDGHVLRVVEKDYVDMRHMIFGEVPAIEAIFEELGHLESEINGESAR